MQRKSSSGSHSLPRFGPRSILNARIPQVHWRPLRRRRGGGRGRHRCSRAGQAKEYIPVSVEFGKVGCDADADADADVAVADAKVILMFWDRGWVE